MFELSKRALKSRIRLTWPAEVDVPTCYANQFAVVGTESEVTIVFGEFLPHGVMARLGDEEPDDEHLPVAQVRPVAKIVLSPTGFEAFVAMIKKHGGDDDDSGADTEA